MDRRIAAAGGDKLTHSPTVGKQKIPNPAHGANGGTDWLVPKEIEVEVQRWGAADGTELQAYQLPDGSWEVTKEQPATPKPPTAGATQKPAGGREGVEGTPTANGPDNERPRWVVRDASGNEVWARPLDKSEMDEWRTSRERSRNPGGKTDQQIKDEAAANKPGAPTLKPDGQGGTIAVQTMPDGTIKTTPLPGVPSEATSKYTEVKQDPQTGKWHGLSRDGKWTEIQGGPSTGTNQPLPANMPQFRPDINKPGLGVIEYAQQLAALKSQGKLTDKQYADAVAHGHQLVTAEAGRLDTIASTQRTLQANEINQRNTDVQAATSRLNSANTATQNALDTSQKMASNFTNKSYGAMGGPILPAVMALQDARAQQWGGMNQPATVGTANYPMLQQVGQMGMTPNPNAVIPAVAQLGNMANPNQIGAGAIGSVTAPGAPGAVSAPAMTAPPATGISDPRDAGGYTGPPTAVPAINPPAGQPGNDPNAPVGKILMDPAQMAASGAYRSPIQLDPARYGHTAENPMSQPVLPAVQQMGLLAQMSGQYPDDVIQEAGRRLGWI